MPTASTAHEQVATVAFDAAGTVWGAAWAGSVALLAAAGEIVVLTNAKAGGEDAWTLEGEGVSLHIEAVGEAGGADSLRAQRCRVTGECRRPGWPARLQASGLRAWRALPDSSEARSLRHVLAWFDDGTAVALDSARHPRAQGHDRDLVNVVLLESAGPVAVEEGRLSLTYRGEQPPGGRPPEPPGDSPSAPPGNSLSEPRGGSPSEAPGDSPSEAPSASLAHSQAGVSLPGAPARIGLELWLADEEEHYPRRMAAEIAGSSGAVTLDGLELWLGRLVAHHAGHDGAGTLIVAHRR